MKAKAIGYWICTVLIAFSFLSGGASQVWGVPKVVEGMTALGYPIHFITMLGVWKVLGVIVILLPRFALVKEWAYAGMMFDMIGALVAHATASDGIQHVLTPIVLGALVFGSWALRPESRRLKQAALAAVPALEKG